ncbi:MAG: Gfo/Idh/MocA family oxidoreductase [Bacteroidota bacterium]
MNKSFPYKWGIIATGKIAAKFAEGMNSTGHSYLNAVASRSVEKAESFAKEFNIPTAYGSYEEICKDPEIDIVYIGTPHTSHYENAIMALKAGKHVLCEKPLAVNAKQAKEMIVLAREKKLFLMEALWMRFLPTMVQLRQWLKEGKIGDIRMLTAGFHFHPPHIDLKGRLFNPSLAGGTLLDIGIYPISLAFMVFGAPPVEVQTVVNKAVTGVDYQASYLFKYEDGAIANLSGSFECSGLSEAILVGTKGQIRIPLFWRGQKAIFDYPDPPHREEHHIPFESSGLQYQAIHMMNYLSQGKLESPIMPHNISLQVHETMDHIRDQWGLTYPGE